MQLLRVLGRRPIAVLWTSQVLSAMGDDLYAIAVLWIAVERVGSGAALVGGAGTLSALGFGLVGGVFADRWDRRRAMICADVARALSVLALPVIATVATLALWHFIAVAVVVSALGSLFDPALQASLPALTGGDAPSLRAANALMDMTKRLARVIAPSLAGLLVAIVPIAHFFTLDAVSFAVSALAIVSLGKRFAWKSEAHHEKTPSIAREIKDAFHVVLRNRSLAWAFGMLAFTNIAWSLFLVGIPLLVARVLGAEIGSYGLVMGAYGVGNVASNVVMGSVGVQRRMLVLFAGTVVWGAGFVLLAVAPSVGVAMLGAALAAVGGPMGDVTMLTMMQTDVASGQLGKVFALRITTAGIGTIVGTALAIPLFDGAGVRGGILAAAIPIVVCGVLGVARFASFERSRENSL